MHDEVILDVSQAEQFFELEGDFFTSSGLMTYIKQFMLRVIVKDTHENQ